MFERIARAWSELKAAKPGHRFRRYYSRRRRSRRHGPVRKAVTMTTGSVLMLVGVAGLVLPGPGIVAIALGGALIAAESYAGAKVLDHLELRARHAIRTILRRR